MGSPYPKPPPQPSPFVPAPAEADSPLPFPMHSESSSPREGFFQISGTPRAKLWPSDTFLGGGVPSTKKINWGSDPAADLIQLPNPNSGKTWEFPHENLFAGATSGTSSDPLGLFQSGVCRGICQQGRTCFWKGVSTAALSFAKYFRVFHKIYGHFQQESTKSHTFLFFFEK